MLRQFLSLFVLSILLTYQVNVFGQDSDNRTEVIQVADSSSYEIPEMLPVVYDGNVKNVILLIGDGTGIAQITSGQLNSVGPDGRLYLQTMPVTGIVKTHSSSSLITDSASGATAYSCGIKTYNGAIGVDPDGRTCKTIPEILQGLGYSTGLVATSSITHATPASFASHVPQRSMANEIAAQLTQSGLDVMLGGGLQYFLPASDTLSERQDDLDLISDLKNLKYELLFNKDELLNSSGNKLVGLFALDGLEYDYDEPRIADMTKKALEVLSKDEDGFFLMVEGSQIDWGGHGNNARYVLREVQDFDQAVKAALDFAEEDGETLVILTADHETGGMTLQRDLNDSSQMEIYWTSGSHTGTPVPLMAYGPGSLEFMGWRDNTYVSLKLAELLGITDFPIILNSEDQ
ncbi:alkaline phosphatase [Balneola sp. MJW-20]|uniref:alkaline phosphatase n=1 Tax=Gracilimonas aurantiaca TaxID=3234185 RepID=UPI003466166D